MKRTTVARGGKRGKTSGRGGKGQSARAGNKRRPEWRDIIKRIPKLRGRGKSSHKTIQTKPTIVNLAILVGAFKANESVTPVTLTEKGIISTWSGNIPDVKILGDGECAVALKVSGCYISESAQQKIEKAGGTVTAIVPKVIKSPKKAKKPKVKAKVVAKKA